MEAQAPARTIGGELVEIGGPSLHTLRKTLLCDVLRADQAANDWTLTQVEAYATKESGLRLRPKPRPTEN
jgi:hypothetical protein